MLWINIAGLLLIVLIVWWFWVYKPASASVTKNEVVIVVENGVYQPARIKLPVNESVTLQFLRKDPSPCAEMVVIPDLEISETLPLNKPKTIQLPVLTAGEYTFHCQMKMYTGVLIVD